MYYLYLIESVGGRAGFGIASDPKERNKQYCSHSGDIVKFKFLYGGQRSHAKTIERTIKTQYVDNIWKIEDWKTEWLKDDITINDLKEYVDQLLKERKFLKLDLVATDYDFRQDLNNE
jgi:predicted GIY-YIG superfamily endonuclease